MIDPSPAIALNIAQSLELVQHNLVLSALKNGFSGLLRFSGRDSPAQFWPYALTLFIAFSVGMVFAMQPVFRTMAAFAAAHPERSRVSAGPGHYSIQIEGPAPELTDTFVSLTRTASILLAAMVVLIAAAVVRRLHDRDRSGWWAALPLPFVGYAMWMMPTVFASTATGAPDMTLFFTMFLNNVAYLASLGWLILLLAGAGTDGPNRFGLPAGR